MFQRCFKDALRLIRLREAVEEITQSVASSVPAIGGILEGLADRINPYD